MIEYYCGNCGTKMASPNSMAGEPEKCPNCHKLMKVPGTYEFRQTNPAPPKIRPPYGVIALVLLGIVTVAFGLGGGCNYLFRFDQTAESLVGLVAGSVAWCGGWIIIALGLIISRLAPKKDSNL